MARAVAEGVREVEGVEVEVKEYETPQKLEEYDAIIIGAPTYHRSMTNSIKSFLEEAAFHKVNLVNKIGAAFGSYGWSGEAPRLALEVLENVFKMNVVKPPVLIKYTPDIQGLNECNKFGKQIAEQVS